MSHYYIHVYIAFLIHVVFSAPYSILQHVPHVNISLTGPCLGNKGTAVGYVLFHHQMRCKR